MRDAVHAGALNMRAVGRLGSLEEVLAGNEEHPFASIVAAYHESQTPALDADEAPAETASTETVAEGTPVEEFIPAAESVDPGAAVEEPPGPTVEVPASSTEEATVPEPEPDPTPEGTAPQVEESAASGEIEPTGVPDAEKPSALVDPFKSILAAYYQESLAEGVIPEPELKAEIEAPPVAAAADAAVDLAPADEPPAPPSATDPLTAPLATVVSETPVSDAAPVEALTAEEPEEPRTEPADPHEIPTASSSAAASVLAAYYADAPVEPVEPAAFEAPTAQFPPPAEEATAILPTVTPELAPEDLPQAPVNPLGAGPHSANWGAEALAAAGSTEPTGPVGNAKAVSAAEVTARLWAARAADAPAEAVEAPAHAERRNGRRTFLMLAPVAAIAAIAVLLVLLWNGHKDTPKGAPVPPPTTPTIVLTGGPLKQSQEAYASALSRFTSANDAGGAVVAGGAAHDTLKLLKDFKGATGQDKALLAAERDHLTSLYNLSTASPSTFAGAAGQAKSTLTAVQKAAGADTKAKAPNSAPATRQAINLLGAGNVDKLQQTANSLIAQADAASLTYQLRAVGSSAAGNTDAANSLASVVSGSAQGTASTLAGQFSALAPLVRITADTLSDWSTIRPGVVSALGTNPTAHIDSLIANAEQKIAAWQAQQGNNANTQAINAYASAMRSHFGAFGNALGQIPSLNPNETCLSGSLDGTRSRAGNALVAVNNAANGFRGINAPAALAGADASLHGGINAGTAAAAYARNVTVVCGSDGKYDSSSDWRNYSNNIWIKGGWSGKVGAWEAAVASALQQASASGTKPVV